jgi:hypothetical protein
MQLTAWARTEGRPRGSSERARKSARNTLVNAPVQFSLLDNLNLGWGQHVASNVNRAPARRDSRHSNGQNAPSRRSHGAERGHFKSRMVEEGHVARSRRVSVRFLAEIKSGS